MPPRKAPASASAAAAVTAKRPASINLVENVKREKLAADEDLDDDEEDGVEETAGAPASGPPATPLTVHQEQILALVAAVPEGLGGGAISQQLSLPIEQVMAAMQPLINQGRVELLSQTQGGRQMTLFRLGSEQTVRLMQLSVEERLILGIIEESGTKGIWHKELRPRSNLEPKRINAIIKRLTRDNYIQTVKSVVANKKRLYMLAGLVPDVSLTGGPWYAEDDFDADFVDTLRKLAMKYLHDRHARKYESPLQQYHESFASAEDVLAYIVSTKITSQSLTEDNIERILETLVHDQSATRKMGTAGVSLYKFSRVPAQRPAVMTVPCGVCRVRHNCAPGASISPQNCIYLTEWGGF